VSLAILTPEARLSGPRGPKVVVAGVFGSGKTSLLKTLDSTALASTLFVDCEAGDIAIGSLPVASIRPRTWPECRDIACAIGGPNPALPSSSPYSQAHFDVVIADPVLADLRRFQILFLDSLSEMSRQCRIWAEQQPEAVTDRGRKDVRGVYGLVARELPSFLLQLQHARDRTVIFVCVLELATDDFGHRDWRLQIEGQRTSAVLPGIIDELIVMHAIDAGDGKPFRALICTSPNPWSLPAKDCSGKLDQIEEPSLAKLLAKLTSPQPLNSPGGNP
jgi:hypothetical protein